MKTERERLENLLKHSKDFLTKLSLFDGDQWKESAGELQHPEMVIWLLLFVDSDQATVVRNLRIALSRNDPSMSDVEPVVYLYLVVEGEVFGLKLVAAELEAGAENPLVLAKKWYPHERLPTLFASMDSER